MEVETWRRDERVVEAHALQAEAEAVRIWLERMAPSEARRLGLHLCRRAWHAAMEWLELEDPE